MALHLLDSDDDPGVMAPVADINVTPFVDVMLVLLVIFILTAPLMLSQLPINLPQASLDAMTRPPQPVVVSMDEHDAYYLGSERVPHDQLAQRLRAAAEREPDRIVYVHADRALPYGKVVGLLELVGAAGFARVSLVSRAPDPG